MARIGGKPKGKTSRRPHAHRHAHPQGGGPSTHRHAGAGQLPPDSDCFDCSTLFGGPPDTFCNDWSTGGQHGCSTQSGQCICVRPEDGCCTASEGRMARGGRTKPSPIGRGRKMAHGGTSHCGHPGQPPCPSDYNSGMGSGYRRGGAMGTKRLSRKRKGNLATRPRKFNTGGRAGHGSKCGAGYTLAADGSCIQG